jgi:hypothetical protein
MMARTVTFQMFLLNDAVNYHNGVASFVVNERVWSSGRIILTRETKVLGENLSQFQFAHQIFYVNWPGIEPGPSC